MLLDYQDEIVKLEDEKFKVILRYGECEFVAERLASLDKKLERLYEWLAKEKSKDSLDRLNRKLMS
jgi:G:T-mismatch repair DNA endonuclease (very short patch repair protein)